MPFYTYSAQDATGKWVEGTLHAASADEARRALAAQRLLVQRLGEKGASVPVAPPAPVKVAEAPRPVMVQSPASGSAAVPATVKTGRGSEKDRFFLFSQLHAMLRSGVTPSVALQDLAGRSQNPDYAASLRAAAASSGEGLRLSEAFSRTPRLYPPDVIGTLRAGEAAGFLPEALEEIARQTEDSLKFRRKFILLGCSTWPVLILTPVIVVLVFTATDSMKVQNDSNLTVGPGAAMGQALGPNFTRFLPMLIAVYGLVALGIWFARSEWLAELRHRIVLLLPPLSGRARAEGLARFAWAMGMVSRAGLSPRQAWELAAESVPNRALRSRLLRVGGRMTESARLSPVLRESGVVPDTMASIVANGELTGDVPGALDTVARTFAAENDSHRMRAPIVAMLIVTPLLGLITVGLLFLLYSQYFNGLMRAILGDT